MWESKNPEMKGNDMFFTPVQTLALAGLAKNAADRANDAAATLRRIEEQNKETLARIESQNAHIEALRGSQIRLKTVALGNGTSHNQIPANLKEQLLSDLRNVAASGMLTKQEYEARRKRIFDMP